MQLDDLISLASDTEKFQRAAELARELAALRERDAEIVAELEEMGVATATRPQARGAGRPGSGTPVAAVEGPSLVGAPEEFKQLHRDLWAAGVEIAWYSDHTAVIGGKKVEHAEVRRRASQLISKEDAA